jgi:hypothetical protein
VQASRPEPECSPYLQQPIRTLSDACRETGRDDSGKACPACSLKPICKPQERARSQNVLIEDPPTGVCVKPAGETAIDEHSGESGQRPA